MQRFHSYVEIKNKDETEKRFSRLCTSWLPTFIVFISVKLLSTDKIPFLLLTFEVAIQSTPL